MIGSYLELWNPDDDARKIIEKIMKESGINQRWLTARR